MFSKALSVAKGSIFPIIMTVKSGPKKGERHVAGTGFFIDEEGHFVSALHVMNKNPNAVSFSSLGNIPNITFKAKNPEPIIEIGRDARRDLYVGKLNTEKQPGLVLKTEKPEVGTSVVLGGYPFPNISKTSNGGHNFFTVRQYWQPGIIMDNLPLTLFNPALSYNGFLLDTRTIPGMSGGPALDLEGNVIGMCTAHITRNAGKGTPQLNGVCLDIQELNAGIYEIFNKPDNVSITY